MDFTLSAKQRMMVDTARRIGARHGLHHWLRSFAAADGDGFRLNGRKIRITISA